MTIQSPSGWYQIYALQSVLPEKLFGH